MSLFSRHIRSMDHLFIHTLQDISYAERKIEKALPELIAKADADDLRQALRAHLEETRGHRARLDEAFSRLGVAPKAIPCPAIEGIVDEAVDVVSEVADPEVMDAAVAAAAQTIEHYEIARYGTLVAWARHLGREDVAGLFEKTLAEEKQADATLTELAVRHLDRRAA